MGALPHRLGDLAGSWRLHRQIQDRRAGRSGRLVGTVHLAPGRADRLDWFEAGELHLPPAAPLRATRRYLLRQQGPMVHVHFADGRFFHAFALGNPTPVARHDCPPDMYSVGYDFEGWPDMWRVVWEVRGPRKDYRLESLHQPLR